MNDFNPEYAKKRDAFSTFRMADGSIHKIRNCYLLDFATEAFHGVEPLSKGAIILRDAVATSADAGRLTELLSMLGCGQK